MSLKSAAASRSLDNITTLLISFKNFKKCIQGMMKGQSIIEMREQARIKETSKINGEYLEEGLFNIPEEELKVDGDM